MKRIWSKSPKNWKALQNQTAEILSQCGFTVEIEKTVVSARGKVEIDVYAEETIKGRKYSIACECKHWKLKVPQSTVHSFRTVLNDLGVNAGYLISSNGFQRGAIETSRFAPLELVTWERFQDAFCDTWLEKYFCPTIREKLDPLMGFTDPLVPNWFLEAPEAETKVLRGLRAKYMDFGAIMLGMAYYHLWPKPTPFAPLPLREKFKGSEFKPQFIPDSLLNATAYGDFLDEALAYGKAAIEEFREAKKRSNL